ncbi:hypothetical protein FIBSPDRAFT_850013, partial [Athelia psychrophila]
MRRTGYWADVAFKSGDVEEELRTSGREGRGHRDEECNHGLDSKPVRKLIKAAKPVRRANRKLIVFERGFIDEAGLKGGQWYKHLGVAPGYGATTMPRVTEALSLEKNVTLAEYEADRLAQKIEKMAIHL